MAGISLFGFQFGRVEDNQAMVQKSPVELDRNDSALTINTAPGFISPQINVLDLDAVARTESDLIGKYRDLAGQTEVDQCIEEIISEAIITDKDKKSVDLNLDDLELPDSVKEKITAAYDQIYRLLKFNRTGHDIFKRWYIDGRLNYHAIIDEKDPKAGLKGLRYIDPRKIKKVREIQREVDERTGAVYIAGTKEYFIYNERGIVQQVNQQTTQTAAGMARDIVLTADSVVHCNSGIIDSTSSAVLSHLHKALRSANNLRMMEDAMVIYRLVRAPERRIFYISTGNLPNSKSQQYVQEIANTHKNKIIYDVTTGEIKNDRKFLAMTEDYWIPRKDGDKGTQIETLPGGEQIGETAEPEYFKAKLYASLNVPMSRFSSQPSLFNAGSEITRDELRFSRFIERLRSKFNTIFEDLLGKQVVLTGIMSIEEWEAMRDDIKFDYAEDNYYAEAQANEMETNRLNMLAQADPFVGKYISMEYVYKNILKMSDEDMKAEQKKTAEDKKLLDKATADTMAATTAAQQIPESVQPVATSTISEETEVDELSQSLNEFIRSKI